MNNSVVPAINQRHTAILAMFGASILMSFNGLLIRNMQEATPTQINVYRSVAFISVILMLMAFRYRERTVSVLVTSKPSVWLAALFLSATGILITHSLVHTTIANNMFALCMVPFFTMILAYIFLKETASNATLFTTLGAVIGSSIILYNGMVYNLFYGDMLALLCALGFAAFAITVRAYNHEDMLPALAIAGFFVIIASLVPSWTNLSINLHDLVLCIVWGAGLSGIMHCVFIMSAKYLDATELTVFSLVEYALAPLWVWLFIYERPSNIALLGGAIVFISLLAKIFLETKLSPKWEMSHNAN